MKHTFLYIITSISCLSGYSQTSHELIFPDSVNWNIVNENTSLRFKVRSTGGPNAYFSIEGTENLGIQFDSTGNFKWTPSFDLVDRVEKKKDFPVIFQAQSANGTRARKTITFTVNHVNRSPTVDELPIFYVKQLTRNIYQISGNYVFDADEDPLVFKSIQSQMPEGASLSSQGQLTWTPSRGQFNGLQNTPIVLEFIVEDQPEKTETRGKLKIAQTQQDLPPEILVVPGDSIFTMKEGETLNLKIYISDPNGDDNVRNASFVASDMRLPSTTLKENTRLQYEFIWNPDYEFVQEIQKNLSVEIVFFALDKSNNRAQRRIKVTIADTENLAEKDALQYQKYRNSLTAAYILLSRLDENQKKLNSDYKKARKGKKHRSILNASLGAATGLSPLTLEAGQSQIVSGIGGTTVLTLGTLEATEVIGKSKDAIMEKIKLSIELRNKIQAEADEFARNYATKLVRRTADIDKSIDKLRTAMNDQRLVILELDAYQKNTPRVDDKDLKRVFLDFNEE